MKVVRLGIHTLLFLGSYHEIQFHSRPSILIYFYKTLWLLESCFLNIYFSLFILLQTLSDEDSFKKCSSIVEVQRKIKELITSLLKRYLLTHGILL